MRVEKLKNAYKENSTIVLWFGFLFVLLGITVVLWKVHMEEYILEYTSHRSNQDEVQIVENFTIGQEIRQEFESYIDFDMITLSFSDHDKPQKGKIFLIVNNKQTGRQIYYEEKNASDIRYNEPVEIYFRHGESGMAGVTYEVILKSEGEAEEGLGVYGHKIINKAAKINGKKAEYELSIGIHSTTPFYQILSLGILLLMFLSICVTVLYVFQKRGEEEHIFLFIAIPFLLIMLFLWPGNNVYDEPRHYHTVYHYSNQILGKGGDDQARKIAMRACDVQAEEIKEQIGLPINAQAQNLWYQYKKAGRAVQDTSMIEVDISDYPYVSDGSFVQYTPGILGMSLARVLQLNYFWMMFFARLAIVIFYVILCYLGIRMIPCYKMMMVFIAALPMNLYQASGISYDSFTFAVGFVTFSLIVKLWKEGLRKKGWILLGIFVFLLAQCKGGVYLILLLLLPIIPKISFLEKKWRKVIGIYAVAAVSMVTSFWPTIKSLFIKPLAMEVEQQATVVINSGGIMAKKLHPFYAFQQPIEFIKMLVETTFENIDIYLGQLLGYRTAWSNDIISLVIVLPFLVFILLAVVMEDKEGINLNLFQRLWILMIPVMEYIGMQIIFLVETPEYSKMILGFQGRYFLLLLPVISLLCADSGFVYKKRKEHLYPVFAVLQYVYMYFFIIMFMVA